MKLQTSIRVEQKFYIESKKVFSDMGITFSDAVNIFLAKIAQDKSLPFPLEIPSKELKSRIKNIKNDKNILKLDSIDELFMDLDE